LPYLLNNFFLYRLLLKVNEPWEYTPIDALKDFYWASYQIVQRDVPRWVTVFHDSFRLSFNIWGKFMVNCPNYAMDTHIYQAWFEAGDPASFQEQACSAGANLRLFEDAGVPIVSCIHSSCRLSHL
jgi:glucan 1,3-beta-glucosidase